VNRLIIIDGNAILHRAFHALPPLTAPDGTLVNAVYGFTSMLLRLVTDLTPTHLAVTFDRPAPTFRKKLYADYQIKRPKMDDGLAGQIPLVHDVVSAMQVPIFEQDGFEADDIIGSLCKKYAKKVDQIIVVTGDKDILQLATDTTKIYMPTKGLSEAKLYGIKETQERLGVTPTQIPDYKALAGDQSDNYPGVPGIGPKTAADLLATFGTIENLYASIDAAKDTTISPNVKEKLITNKDLAILSKTLATIKQNIKMKMAIKPIVIEQFSTQKVIAELQRFGFHSLIKRLQTPKGTEKPAVKKQKEERQKTIDEQMSLI
jgi:DNA polymerase-1